MLACLAMLASAPCAAEEDRARNEADAKAAVQALAPAGSTALFRDLAAFRQRPGEATVCGEAAFERPESKAVEWRAFMSGRTKDGWKAIRNPTAVTRAMNDECLAETRRLNAAHDAPGADKAAVVAAMRDLSLRCTMDSAIFWIDYTMACAGFSLDAKP